MSKSLEQFLLMRGLSMQESRNAICALFVDAPWFGGEEEVSEAIGVELLEGVLPVDITAKIGSQELVNWHNENIRSRQPELDAANIAYASLLEVVRQFGVEDGLGRGDFWVIEDSFSESKVLITAFGDAPLPVGMKDALAKWLDQQTFIDAVAVINREGEALAEFSKPSNV